MLPASRPCTAACRPAIEGRSSGKCAASSLMLWIYAVIALLCMLLASGPCTAARRLALEEGPSRKCDMREISTHSSLRRGRKLCASQPAQLVALELDRSGQHARYSVLASCALTGALRSGGMAVRSLCPATRQPLPASHRRRRIIKRGLHLTLHGGGAPDLDVYLRVPDLG